MRKIVVVENLSLDGVMQAPGRADEDLRDIVDAQTTTTGVVIATYHQPAT